MAVHGFLSKLTVLRVDNSTETAWSKLRGTEFSLLVSQVIFAMYLVVTWPDSFKNRFWML